MKRIRLYLDTSVINFAIAEDIPVQDKDVTMRLCHDIGKGVFEGHLSDVVLREIAQTPDILKKKQLADVINGIDLAETFEVTAEVEALARKYIDEKIIPVKYFDDALHIAGC